MAALIKRSRDAVSDDFKLTKEAKELFRDLKEIDKFPASLEVESIADIRSSVVIENDPRCDPGTCVEWRRGHKGYRKRAICNHLA